MLQIISGKFFKSDDRHSFDGLGVLYSNVSCWRPLETAVATLHPVDPHGSVTRYVVTYKNQIEREATNGFSIARTGDAEIIDQFRLLLMIVLGGFFTTQRREIEQVCRSRPASANDYVPSMIFDRFCDARIVAEAEDFSRCEALISDVLGLPRKTYVAVMSYLKNFANALEAADTNIDLAYSMLMYGIEALSQQFDGFEPSWPDYDEGVRKGIDKLLANETTLRESVRATLLQSNPIQNRQRAARFAEKYLPDEFFEGEHLKYRKLPLRRSLVRSAILNAYTRRSKFVHELKRGQDPLQRGAFAELDVLTRGFQPFLTFRGLVRVAQQVVREFIARHEKVSTEEIDWRSELPGVMVIELASPYWVGRADKFRPDRAHNHLSAFLGEVEEARTAGGKVTHLNAVTIKIEKLFKNKPHSAFGHRAMACLYVLYHTLIEQNPELERKPPDEETLDKCDVVLAPCSIEALVRDLLLHGQLRWSREECTTVVAAYEEEKVNKTSVKLPPQMEAALLAEIGNLHLDSPADLAGARGWFHKARLELVGHPEKQDYLRSCETSPGRASIIRLLSAWIDDKQEPPTTTQQK